MRTTGLFLVGLAAWFVPAHAHAQYYNPYAAYYQMQQQMWMQQAYNGMGGYGMGYQAPVMPPVSSSSSSYGGTLPANPYLPNGSGYGMSPAYGYGGYNPYNPYGYGYGAGSALMGVADTMRGYGNLLTQTEQARLQREQYNQAKIDTRKKQIELELYIKSITPTYNQDKERITKATLRRMLTNPLPGEISNGLALNVILDDLRPLVGKKVPTDTILVDDATLKFISVSKTSFGLGVLRDNGKVTWPLALAERMKPDQEQALNNRIQDLVKDAMKGKLDNAGLVEVRNEMEKIREELVKKVNEIHTQPYLEAKRFLLEFDQATLALERGEALEHGKFQRFSEGGKSIQEIAEYMVQHGLRFGPATANAEAAYRTLHRDIAAYDTAVNMQLVEAK